AVDQIFGNEFRERVERRVDALRLFGDKYVAIFVTVSCNFLPEAVDDPPAKRRQKPDVDAILIRHHGILIGVQHLEIIEPARQRRHQRRLPPRQHHRAAGKDAALLLVLIARHYVNLRRLFCRRPKPKASSGKISSDSAYWISTGASGRSESE